MISARQPHTEMTVIAPTTESADSLRRADDLPERRPSQLAYYVLAAFLTLYVALCTPHRDARIDADAWEHHRVIVALTDQMWNPGNPTFASDVPSIRYSPYFLVQAAICRLTDLDPYDALSVAATLNTLLLCIGVRLVLRAWGEAPASALALLCIVSLWGVAPGYAGSTALADLPWHQVNPSAFSFATFLIALSLLKRWLDHGRGAAWRWPLITFICVLAMLDHGMTGAFALLALGVTAATTRSCRRIQGTLAMFVVGAVTLGACLLWPWYPFWQAVVSRLDTAYWFNGAIMQLMLLQWCAPAVLLSLATLARFDRPLVRVAFAIGAAGLVMTLFSLPVASATFARFLMPATVLLQMGIATWAYRCGILKLSTWRDVARTLLTRDRPDADRIDAAGPVYGSVLMLLFVVAILYGLLPQVRQVLREPYLARPLVARFLHLQDKGEPIKPVYDRLLNSIGKRDVVLADAETAWPIPSSRGRIVSALHYERFVEDQPARDADVARFFAADASAAQRDEILKKYDVRWIVLDLSKQPREVVRDCLLAYAERSRAGNLVLLKVN